MMRFAWMLALVWACGCGRGAKSGQIAGDQDAVRFERGTGVARDYTRALQRYQERCDSGRGDLVACRKFVIALQLDRGEPRDAEIDIRAWMTRACEQGDWLACVPPIAPLDAEKASAACDAGHPPACLAATWAHVFNQSGTVESADHRRLERACDGEVLEACEQLATRLLAAGDRVPGAVEHRLQRACELGDADACAALGRPIAADELCRAHDFRACAQAGALGDIAALERACDHGIADACERLAVAARDADPPDPRVAARFARACAVGAAICIQNRPDDLAIGCAAYQPRRIPAGRRLQLPVLGGVSNGTPWSASPGRPFLIMGARTDTSPGQYADLARRLSPDAELLVLANAVTDTATFAPARVISLGPASAAAPLAAPAGSPEPGDPLAMRLGDGWPAVVDRTGAPRAVLSIDSGIVPATLARCTRGLLALP